MTFPRHTVLLFTFNSLFTTLSFISFSLFPILQVCKLWCHLLYDDSRYWKNLTFVIYYNQFRQSCLTVEGEEATDASSSSPSTKKLAEGMEGSSNINNANGDNRNSSGEQQSINNANQVTNKTTNTSAVNRASSSAPIANLNVIGDSVSDSPCSDNQTMHMDFSGTPWDLKDKSTGGSSTLSNGGPLDMNTSNPFDVPLNNGSSANFYSKMLMMPTASVTSTASTTTQSTYPTLALLSDQSQVASEADCRSRLYLSVKMRGFDAICLQGATDADIIEFTTQAALSDGLEKFAHVSIRHSSITDKGLEVFLASIARSLQSFELIGKLIRLCYLILQYFKLYFVRMQRNLRFRPVDRLSAKFKVSHYSGLYKRF